MKRHTLLDALRGVAIFFVLASHIFFLKSYHVGTPPLWAKFWVDSGWIGVDLFFVLSGLLVSRGLFREYQEHGKVRVLNFFIKRGFKIYPSFLAVLLTVTAYMVHGQQFEWSRFWPEITFLQSYFNHCYLIHGWSLSVEEHFYLLLGLGFAIVNLKKARVEWTPRLFVAAIVGCLALRYAVGSILGFRLQTTRFPSLLRMDSLMCGVFLAYLIEIRNRSPRGRWPRAIFALVGFAFVASTGLWWGDNAHRYIVDTVGLTTLFVGCGFLVYAASGFGADVGRKNILLIPLAAMGRWSYNIYLWHMFVATLFMPIAKRFIKTDFYGDVAVYVVVSILIGWAGTRFIEAPTLRWRDRLLKKRLAGGKDASNQEPLRQAS